MVDEYSKHIYLPTNISRKRKSRIIHLMYRTIMY
jgi:hypothetical protein